MSNETDITTRDASGTQEGPRRVWQTPRVITSSVPHDTDNDNGAGTDSVNPS